ncbi:hypothetical protein LTS18_012938, partial [Coniosporium uncinatum]
MSTSPDLSDTQAAEAELLNVKRDEWPSTIKAHIGALLVSKLIETAKLPTISTTESSKQRESSLEPAFVHSMKYRVGRKLGYIEAQPALTERLAREPVHSTLAAQLPMLHEPRPWTGFTEGGFLQYPTQAVRQKGADDTQRLYTIAAVDKGHMSQVFRGLDVLGKTPWRINADVFQVMADAWNSGEEIANFPAEHPDISYPPEPAPSDDPRVRRTWLREVQRLTDAKSGFHSQRCFINFQLEVARAYLNETFYYPHNLDFRGRAYPVPPYLNHVGADNARGVLIFGKGKELGETGLRWLKIHLANVFGFDKASLQEREEFAMAHLEDIRDTVTNPLKGRRWWLKAEDPWQCLATCFELNNALNSPDPTRFVSHLPVHQDGTCNGLQHYAALGGDKVGAAQVNLVPGDRPADIYTAVAELVKADIKNDVALSNQQAKALDGNITRKVVKQTVMTNVYGVTFVGAREQ